LGELATIFGLSGPRLTASEKLFFRDARPWGFILFSRNIETPDQLRALCAELRGCVGRDALIFIDQEGGRVRRLRPPHWPDYPAGQVLAHVYALDRRAGLRACYLHHRLIADDLRALGITANCTPVLDLPVEGADPIISDRALGDDTGAITAMAHAAMAGLMSGGIAPVIKHIPGHGRANVDSHKALPKITAKAVQLRTSDFIPFAALSDAPMAMTAHAVFDCADQHRPVTTSKKALTRLIREDIGFEGLLMSDDLDMKALHRGKLSGDLAALTEQSLAAGCDIALQCSGKLADMVKVAKGAKTLSGAAAGRAFIADQCAVKIKRLNRQAAREEYDALLATRLVA
jgi:beta-N-acetylhexosaminidase